MINSKPDRDRVRQKAAANKLYGQPWSVEEDAKLRAFKIDMVPDLVIADQLGRSLYSVKEHWRWINMNEDQRQRRRDGINHNRGCKVKPHPSHHSATRSTSRPSDDIFAERDRRLHAPRTLTSWFCGDPAPGQSALCKRSATP